MYLILSDLSYVLLGIFSILITTYLIPIFKIFKDSDIENYKINTFYIYLGFILSYILIYTIFKLLMIYLNPILLNFLNFCLFIFLIIYSIFLALDITIMDYLGGFNIKRFKIDFLTSLFFGLKYSMIQILSNLLVLILLLINLSNYSIKSNLTLVFSFDIFLRIFLFLFGLILTNIIISNLSDKKFSNFSKLFSTKQNILNILSSFIIIIISFVYILVFFN